MKLTFKTLQQEQFQLEVAPEDTILDVKRKINEERNIAESSQKLIYSGKILVDDKTVASYDIKENGFIVVMVTKAAPTAASASTSKATTAATPKTTTTTTTTTAETSAKPSGTPTPTAAAAAQTSSDASQAATGVSALSASEALVTGEHFEQAVQNMMEMGFPREQVISAMRASFNNPDRAVEYLMTGIPEGLEVSGSSAPNMTTSMESEDDQHDIHGGAGGDMSNIAFLQSNPHFQRLRQTVHNNPELLQPLLQQLAQANPRLMELIEENQQEFMQMLLEGDDGEGNAEGASGAEGVAGLPNIHYIDITEEEKEAIDRLVAMGFDRAQAVEAYLACDKNEELAANFLFDSMQD
ncbi:XPC-binding domain-containing protein [Syncephalis plumigaleata]|nr:XPC-binding domain-containing protein [Syncephalis plumigaleata]